MRTIHDRLLILRLVPRSLQYCFQHKVHQDSDINPSLQRNRVLLLGQPRVHLFENMRAKKSLAATEV